MYQQCVFDDESTYVVPQDSLILAEVMTGQTQVINMGTQQAAMNPPHGSMQYPKRHAKHHAHLTDFQTVTINNPNGGNGNNGNGGSGPQLSSAIDKSKLKTKMCRAWSQGVPCAYGDRCAFAHGEQEKSSQGTPMESPLQMQKVTLTSRNLRNIVSTPNTLQNTSNYVNAVQQPVQQQVQQSTPISTPIQTPLTPVQESFSQHMTPYDNRTQYADTPLDTPLTPGDFGHDSNFLRRGDTFTLEAPSPMDQCLDGGLRGPADTLSLNGGGFGASSLASSHYRYDPYADPRYVSQVAVAAPSVASTAGPVSLSHGPVRAPLPTPPQDEVVGATATADVAAAVAAAPTLKTTAAVSPAPVRISAPSEASSTLPSWGATVCEPSTPPRNASPHAHRVSCDNSPSDQMLTSEDCSTVHDDDAFELDEPARRSMSPPTRKALDLSTSSPAAATSEA